MALFVSLTLHILAVIALIYFTPIRQILTEALEPARPTTPTMSASQLEELSQTIEVSASEILRQNVETLDNLFEQIRRLQTDVDQEFAQFDAQRTQKAAQDALKEMTSAMEKMNEAVELLDRKAPTEEIDRAQALAEQAQQRAKSKLAQVPYDVAPVQTEHVKAQKSHLQAKEVFNEQLKMTDGKTNREARLKTAQATVDRNKQTLEKARSKPKPNPNSIKQIENRLKDNEQKLADAHKELEQSKAKLEAARPKAGKTQREAVEVQKRVIKKLAAVIKQHPQVSVKATARQLQKPETHDAAAMDAAKLYDTARNTEDKVAETFKDIRAMDLAMVRDMKLKDARKDIDVVRPHRPELDAKLLRKAVRTESQFKAAKKELRTALRETNSMVDLAGRMLEMARESVDGMKFGAQAASEKSEGQARARLQLKIKELAMEDVSGRFSDLSRVMKQAQAAQAEQGQGGGGDAPIKEEEEEEKEGEETLPDDGGTMLKLNEEGKGAGSMPVLTKDTPAVGARKISAAGEPTEWMFVDTWYTLGPFPNPSRVNIDREFPPDSIIDLDANYTGKGGRTVRWRFAQSANADVTPSNAEEYGIWYAYTELHFDEPRDMIIAMGTDDRGILKINDVPVWVSSKRLKGWTIDEVWRKVHFNKGLNRILYRVENGHQHIAFSMVLHTVE